MTPEVKTYLKAIAATENYSQLMKDLFLSATDSVDEQVWERRKDFCETEVIPNIAFIVSAALEEIEDMVSE